MTADSLPCPACGEPATALRPLLGGYWQIRCLSHGTAVVFARKKLMLEWWPAPSTGDENSDEAADAVMEVAGAQRRRVLDELAVDFGSSQELEERLGLPGNSVRPRLWELRKAGLIERVGKGLTPSGRSCWRYGLTAAGRRVVA